MNFIKNEWLLILILIFSLLGLELASFFAFAYPFLNILLFFVILFVTIFLSIYKLEWGLFIVLVELVMGSKGYLFYLPFGVGHGLSLRIALWSAFILIFAYRFFLELRSKESRAKSVYLKNLQNFSFKREYLLLAFFAFIALISAFIYGNNLGFIFSDFNAWLYFLLIVPLVAIKPNQEQLFTILLTTVFVLSLKTFILFNVFSLGGAKLSIFTYQWLRKTLVGEMTLLDSWNRVFIQSQIFIFLAYFFLLFKNISFMRADMIKAALRNKAFYLNLFLAGFFISSIIISLSRSFWLAGAISLGILFLILLFKFSKKQVLFSLLFIVLSFIIGFSFVKISTLFNAGLDLGGQIKDRVSETNESAISSRWAQLPELMTAIAKNPITGQGFGADVTYKSEDPRVLASQPNGIYTTYAFEWGYLDLTLKMGLAGLLAYLLLITSLLNQAWRAWRQEQNYIFISLVPALIFLALVHTFTPYLNHPLGIGFILFSSCLISQNKVY